MSEMSQDEKSPQLKRNIKLFEAILFVIGFVIGSGIFLKPSVVLKNTGSSGGALMVWILGGLMSLCAALTISEIAAYIPKIGGLYTYLAELYGDVIGYLYGWVEGIISSPGSCAALAISFATFSTFFIPMSGIQQKMLAILMVFLIVAAQVISTKFGVWLQTLSTIGKLIPLAAIIIFGLLNGSAHDISMVNVGVKGAGIGAALLGVLWAYDGWLNTCTLGAEIEKPEKNLPKTIIIGVIFVILVYALFNIAIFNSLPASQVVASEKIGIDVSKILFGGGGAAFITIGMMVSVFGALNAQMACGTRIAFAMAKNKQLPAAKALSVVNPKLFTPVNSLIFQGILSVIYILTGSFNSITDLVIFSIWIFFTLGVFGVFILRKKVTHDVKLYRVPLYPITPILGIIGGVYLMYSTLRGSFSQAMLGIGLTLIGLPVYYYCKNKNEKVTMR